MFRQINMPIPEGKKKNGNVRGGPPGVEMRRTVKEKGGGGEKKKKGTHLKKYSPKGEVPWAVFHPQVKIKEQRGDGKKRTIGQVRAQPEEGGLVDAPTRAHAFHRGEKLKKKKKGKGTNCPFGVHVPIRVANRIKRKEGKKKEKSSEGNAK